MTIRRAPSIAIWAAAAVLTLAVPVAAQQPQAVPQGVLATGNAAVTGFSGAPLPMRIAPGVDPGDQTFIDPNGPSLRIVDLQHLGGPPAAQLVQAPKPMSWTAGQIGQVFAVTLDAAAAPNIYVAASSAYGLPIVAPAPAGAPAHVRTGAAGATFMPGLWGSAPDAGPGSIWKIDGVTGAVGLFADVRLDGRRNSGAALGGLAFDPESQSLYVADRETGMIQRYAADGAARDRYDHGVTGRQAQGLPRVTFDPAPALDITSAAFDSGDSATWHLAAPERRIFGLGIFRQRLYYAVAQPLEIWSVGLAPDGAFGSDPTPEVAVPPGDAPSEISKITFDEQGRMLLAERAEPTGAHDFEVLTPPGTGRVLRYAFAGPDQERNWQAPPDDYAIGFPLHFHNGNGGVAIGYLYNPRGDLDHDRCGGFLWSTGEALRQSSDPAIAQRLAKSGPPNVDGLQGNGAWLIRHDDTPPFNAYFIDYDDRFDDSAARGHLGDIAIARACTPGRHTEVPPPRLLSGPPGNQYPPHTPPPKGQPPQTPPSTPPSSCPPGQSRRDPTAACGPPVCARPNVRVGDQCCSPAALLANGQCPSPACPAGQTATGPNNTCCSSNLVYAGANGQQACCLGGQVVNGQCQQTPPVPPGCTAGSTDPSCCGSGYVPSGNACCLASQVTSTGICCPSGQAPSGPNNSQCQIIKIPIPPGKQCCAAGQVIDFAGSCCPVNLMTTTGQCCPAGNPPDPKDRSHCPAQIQSIAACAPGYTRLPDGSCCNDRSLGADSKTCGAAPGPPPSPSPSPPPGRTPPADCAAQGPNFIRDPRHPRACIHCTGGRLANDDHTACIRVVPPLRHRPPRDDEPDVPVYGPYGPPPGPGFGRFGPRPRFGPPFGFRRGPFGPPGGFRRFGR